MGGMVFGGVQQERIQFNEKRFGLADQAVRVSIRTGIAKEQSHLGSIREKLEKVINQGQKGNPRNFLQVFKKGLVPIKILETYI